MKGHFFVVGAESDLFAGLRSFQPFFLHVFLVLPTCNVDPIATRGKITATGIDYWGVLWANRTVIMVDL